MVLFAKCHDSCINTIFNHIIIFFKKDSFANVVDLLDDMFERCVALDEPLEMNFIKKHAKELELDGIERPAAR